MANLAIFWNVKSDLGVLSGGSWAAALPLKNLQNVHLSQVARSADAELASTQFDLDFGRLDYFRGVVLIAHNLTAELARVRVRAAQDAGFAQLTYDSGWQDAYAAIFPHEELEWEDDNWWSGKLSEADLAGYTRNFVCDAGAIVTARHVRVEIDDTENASGYVDVGRLVVAPAWQTKVNFSFPHSLAFEPRTLVEESIGGQEFFDVRRAARVMRFSLDWLSDAEGYAQALELTRRKGVSGDLFVVPDPAEIVNLFRRSFYGRLRRLSPLEHYQFNLNSMGFEIKERL